MQQSSGVLNAIRELEKEAKKLHEAISLLKRFQSQRAGIASAINARPHTKLSPAARRRISEASKKRWEAFRNAKAKAAKK
jgi:hypothetical protein